MHQKSYEKDGEIKSEEHSIQCKPGIYFSDKDLPFGGTEKFRPHGQLANPAKFAHIHQQGYGF